MSQKHIFLAASTVGLVTVIACKKHNDNPPLQETTTFRVQAVHASPKTGDIEVRVGDITLPAKVSYLSQSSGYTTVQTKGDATVQVAAGGAVIAQGTCKPGNNFKYTIFVYDTLGADKKVKYLLVQDTFPTPASGKTNLRFLHFAPGTGAVDVDMFKGRDSLRLVNAHAYTGTKTPDGKFSPVASGDYHVKVRIRSGSAEATILDVPSVKLESGTSVTLYLKGLTKGSDQLGLQLVQHK